MDLAEFVKKHKPLWDRFEQLLEKAEKSRFRDLSPDEIQELGRLHRRVNSDYAFLSTFFSGSRVTLYLNRLVARAHALIYRGRATRLTEIYSLLKSAPSAFRKNASVFVFAFMIFIACFALGYGFTLQEPAVATLFLSEEVLDGVRQGRLWTEGLFNVMPGSLISVRVLANNVSVTIGAFALGLTVIGPVYIVALNAFMMGSAFAYCEPYGLSGGLLQFILAHGPLEISAILLSATAGLVLARALLASGLLSRMSNLRLKAPEALSLFIVALVALCFAALLEGFVSPSYSFPSWLRAGAGFTGAAALFFFLLSGKATMSGGSYSVTRVSDREHKSGFMFVNR